MRETEKGLVAIGNRFNERYPVFGKAASYGAVAFSATLVAFSITGGSDYCIAAVSDPDSFRQMASRLPDLVELTSESASFMGCCWTVFSLIEDGFNFITREREPLVLNWPRR